MSELCSEQMISVDQGAYLGPARVGQVLGQRLELIFPDQSVWAQIALAFPYQPVCGDTILAAGQNDIWYVIGVLSGSGKSSFVAPADLQLLAPRGEILLSAAKGIRLRSSVVRIVAHRLDLFAQKACERFESARRWVRGAYFLRSGSARTVVDSTYRLGAKRIRQRAADDVRIDGTKIHLG